jgi:hypothetical protein
MLSVRDIGREQRTLHKPEKKTIKTPPRGVVSPFYSDCCLKRVFVSIVIELVVIVQGSRRTARLGKGIVAP